MLFKLRIITRIMIQLTARSIMRSYNKQNWHTHIALLNFTVGNSAAKGEVVTVATLQAEGRVCDDRACLRGAASIGRSMQTAPAHF